MRYIKEILKKNTILIILPIFVLLITVLIVVGITNAANSTTELETEQTFTEDGDGYYIWVRAVDHAGNKGPWSEAQRIWIDNKGPSAPVIQGGSTAYALSRTISVKTAADDSGASGIAYYEYYKKSGSDKPADSVTGAKVTTTTTSQTFNTNIAGEYVFFRAVDVVGNKGAWSDGQQVYIDVNKPTVTCTAANSTLTIKQGDNKTLSSYFTVTPTGTNKAYTTTYKIGSTAYENTSTLAVGTHTVTCTATITGGNSNSATMTVVVVSAEGTLATTKVTIKPSSSSNVQIVIPVGFGIAKLEGSNSVNSLPGQSGKVIGILPNEEWNNITVDQINQGIVVVNNSITYDGGNATGSVPDFEEYVWVPIPDSSSFARKSWTTLNGFGTNGWWVTTGVMHSLAEVSTSNRFWEDKTTTEYKNMVSSVNTNKGFYIGRYEASKKNSTVAQVKRGQTVWTSISQTNAITYSKNNSISNSHLIYGIEWDSVLSWLIGKATIGSSTSGSTKTMTLSDIQDDSRSWGNYTNSNGNAATGKGTIRATGYSEYWKANNIYDIAGSVYEWTQEHWSTTGTFATRGGSYNSGGASYPPAFRGEEGPEENSNDWRISNLFLFVNFGAAMSLN